MSATTFRETVTGFHKATTDTAGGRQREEAAYNPPEMVDGEYKYEVLVLGTRGAGKTSFLAAFYKQLLMPGFNGNHFFVEIQNRQATDLLNTYEQLTNPKLDWPPGNANVNEYEFHFLRVITEDKILPLFRFNYIDYPGGYLTDGADDADSFDFVERVQRAHSVLVLIDGQKVLQSLEGLPAAGGSLDRDLDAIIRRLVRCANLPVHFVVTKWDILKDRHHTLERVRNELHKNTSFCNFVSLRAARKLPLHLIPVSVVGDKFAVFNRDQMRMEKLKDGTAQPYHLHLPVGLTIVDQLLLLKSNVPKHSIFARVGAVGLSIFHRGYSDGCYRPG